MMMSRISAYVVTPRCIAAAAVFNVVIII